MNNNQNWKAKRYGPKQPEHNINKLIRHAEVRVTGDGIEPSVMRIQDALKLAEEMQLDLVEIAPNAVPPVCRIIEYGKYLYELKQKKKEQRKNSNEQKVKEMQVTLNIGDADIQTKVNNARGWLTEGDKVRCILLFKGRNIVYKDRGEMLLLRIFQMLMDIGKADQLPQIDGKRMTMLISPKKTK